MAKVGPPRARAAIVLVLGAALFGPRAALAQAGPPADEAPAARAAPRPEDEAVADELFRQGRAALEARDYGAACAKFAESQRLSPRGGTLLNLARCHELEGKTASAWAEFGAALRQAKREGRPDREQIAREHLGALEARLSRLTVVVPPAADLPGLVVRCDGTEFKRAVWGGAVPVDPGPHVVEASAPGRLPFRASVRVGPEGDRQSVTLPPLREAPSDPAAGREAPGPAAPPPWRSIGWAALGVGAAGLGVSALFGGLAIAEGREADDRCGGDGDPERCLDRRGVRANERAKSFADASTLSAAFGLALAGAGIYLVLSHPRGAAPGAPARPPASAIVVGPRGVGLVARF
ncbi:MAG TPA: hypothetical protein VFS43_47415 [Polyangiaceae bacterium]|nr:hypothetical protein [Polyangiaceae bacterium]